MKIRRATALLLILLMIVSLLPALGAGVLAAGTRYEEVDVLSADGDYILAAVKDDNGVYAIAIDGRNTKTVELSVSPASGTASSYIETDDSSVVWAYSASEHSFKNGERYFYPGSSSLATSSSKRAITYENGHLSFPTSSSGTYYITCKDGTFGTSGDSTAAAAFRLFKKAAADPEPVDPPAGESGTYQLVNAPQSGGEYLVVSSNSAGSAYALKNPGGTSGGASMGSTAVTIGSDGTVKTADTGVVWIFTANGEGFNLTNGNDYLEGASGQIKIFNPQKYPERYWTYSENQLKHVGGTNTYILYYSNGFASATSSNENKIYLFEKVNESTEPVSVSGVSLNKTSLTLEAGETAALTATVTPANAANKSVTWSSSDTTVATVADGVVTAVAAGTATITVTTADGGKTATCTVTVVAAEPAPEATVAEFMKLKESSVWLIRVPAGNDKVVTCGGQAMKWSSYYEAHVLTVEAAQQPAVANLVVTMTSGTPTAVGYPTKGNDANGTGKVDMSDVQYIYNLYNGRYASLTAAGGMEKVLGADIDKNGKVDTSDATAVLTALREVRA